MTYAETLARLAYYLLVATLLGGGLWLAFRESRPSVIDARTGTPGLAVEIDAGTGCHYIVTPWGGIVPRLKADGTPMCPSAHP